MGRPIRWLGVLGLLLGLLLGGRAVRSAAGPLTVRPLPGGGLEVVGRFDPADPALAPFLAAEGETLLLSLPLALPPDVRPVLTVEAWQEAPLEPAAAATAAERLRALRPRLRGDGPAAEASSGPIGPTLEEVGRVRGVRLARLRVPLVREGRRTVRFALRISWTGGNGGRPPDPPFDRILAGAVLNPWDLAAAPPEPPAPRTLPAAAGPRAWVEVRAPGLYRIPYEALQPLGFDGVDPARLHLRRGGRAEVAWFWEGDGDGRFEAGEALLFYAEPRPSRWITGEAYLLTVEGTGGLLAGTADADPSGLAPGVPWLRVRLEANRLYTPDCLCGRLPAGRDGDRWAWTYLVRPGAPAFTATVDLPALAPTLPATLTLWAIGTTDLPGVDPDHRLAAAVEGQALGSWTWNGRQAVTWTVTVPAGLLKGGTNRIRVELPGLAGVSVEGAYLDALALQVPLGAGRVGLPLSFTAPEGNRAYEVQPQTLQGLWVLDVTDPLRPLRLQNVAVVEGVLRIGVRRPGPRRIWVGPPAAPARVRAEVDPFALNPGGTPTGADLLVVVPPELAPALEPLLALRQAQGWRVALADPRGAYDRYGEGRPDPEAIRALVAEAYRTWSPAPRALLLVGDGTFDPKGYRPTSGPTWIPPYFADTDPWAGEVPADGRYAAVDGADPLPDLLVGRLPVRTAAELADLTAKLVAYEEPWPGMWDARHLFVLDDPDAAGDFPAEATGALGWIPAGEEVLQLACADDPAAPLSTACVNREALARDLQARWSEGALFLTWIGHSSWHQWEHGRLFHVEDVPDLRNGPRLPVVLEMTCFTAFFARPETTVLDEVLLLHPGGGAVAAFGPASGGLSAAHGAMLEGWYRGWARDGLQEVGALSLAARLAVDPGLYLWMVDSFHLLGDPATRLNETRTPWASRLFLPLNRRP